MMVQSTQKLPELSLGTQAKIDNTKPALATSIDDTTLQSFYPDSPTLSYESFEIYLVNGAPIKAISILDAPCSAPIRKS